MAQKITVALEDDLDGGPADETLRFGLGGLDYEIDLSKKNARRFRRQIAPYIEHAWRAGRGQRRRAVRTASSRERSGDIRAKDHGTLKSPSRPRAGPQSYPPRGRRRRADHPARRGIVQRHPLHWPPSPPFRGRNRDRNVSPPQMSGAHPRFAGAGLLLQECGEDLGGSLWFFQEG
jgi:Lsr2